MTEAPPEVRQAWRSQTEPSYFGLGRPLGRWIDRRLGRGSYPLLQRWLDPGRVCTQRTYARVVAGFLGPEVRWLDAGCGRRVLNTRSAVEEQEMAGGVRCAVGCDLDLPALHKQRTLSARACADLGQLPFASGNFDVVTLNYVAEHFSDPERVFRELGRVLAPGGRLVLLTPNASSYYVKIIRLGRRLLPQGLIDRIIRHLEYREPDDVFPAYYRANTAGELREIMRRAGLTEESLTLMAEQPLFYFALPLSAFELLITRALMWLRWKQCAAVAMIGVYQRPGGAAQKELFRRC